VNLVNVNEKSVFCGLWCSDLSWVELFVLSIFFADFPLVFSPVKAVYVFVFLLFSVPNLRLISLLAVRFQSTRTGLLFEGAGQGFSQTSCSSLVLKFLPLQSCPQARAKATFSLLVLFFRWSVFSFPFRLRATQELGSQIFFPSSVARTQPALSHALDLNFKHEFLGSAARTFLPWILI
jgi:hypothetical protein